MELDPREQRVALLLALAGALLLAALRSGSPGWLVLGLVMSGALAVAAWRRNRPVTAVAAFVMAFAPWGWAFILGAAYIALAAWLLLRGGARQFR